MHIGQLNIYEHRRPFGAPVTNAHHRWQEQKSLFITIANNQGLMGLGEATPLPDYSPDSFLQCKTTLYAVKDALTELSLELSPIRAVQQCLAEVRTTLQQSPAAQFGLETALFDLLAKHYRCSIGQLLAAAIYQANANENFEEQKQLLDIPFPTFDSIPLNGLLSLDTHTKTLISQAEKLVQNGFNTLKLKGGFSHLSDHIQARRIFKLRQALGEAIQLRLDVNGAWSFEQAQTNFQMLAPFKLQFIEEPVMGTPVDLLDSIGTSIPIALDESLANGCPKSQLFKRNKAQVLILKPAILGGIVKAHTLGQAALTKGKQIVVTHIFDGPVALSACRETAFGFLTPPLACGLSEHSGTTQWPIVQTGFVQHRGRLVYQSHIGHGISPTKLLAAL